MAMSQTLKPNKQGSLDMQNRLLFLVTILLFSGLAHAQALYTEGVHYRRLAVKQPTAEGQVEVREFFSYACPHCRDFDPYIETWKKTLPKNVKVTLVPVTFRPSWVPMAQAYYAGEFLGVLDKTHVGIFTAIHEKGKKADTPEQIADIVAELGVDRQKFVDAMNSFEVDNKIRQSKKMLPAYGVQGVPAVAVNGQYITGGSMAGSYSELLKVMDYLIQQSSKTVSKKTVAK